jgi:hypothetical protein
MQVVSFKLYHLLLKQGAQKHELIQLNLCPLYHKSCDKLITAFSSDIFFIQMNLLSGNRRSCSPMQQSVLCSGNLLG